MHIYIHIKSTSLIYNSIMINQRKATVLTYLGAIPFVFALLVALYDHFNLAESLGYEIKFARFKSYLIAHTYGAVIIGFLAGIQWGVSLNQESHKGYFIVSNLLALLAWFSLFALASFNGVMMIAVAVILAWLIDRQVYRAGLIPEWFWQLRTNISSLILRILITILLAYR